MGIRLGDLVERFGGQLVGDADLEVEAIAPLDSAGASHISFLSNSKLRALAAQSGAAGLILSPLDDPAVAATYEGTRIVTTNPYAYFARVAQYFAALTEHVPAPGVHPSAVVAASAQVDPSAHVGPHVTIEDGAVIGAHVVIDAGCFIGREAVIGEHTHLFANVTFHARCRIGKRGILHSGAVIGTDGFGFAVEGGVYIKIPQTGRVLIGDDVDIGASTTIDRGALEDTVIEDGVKLDNQIQIGHNCRIGAHTAMAGCVGVAGSAAAPSAAPPWCWATSRSRTTCTSRRAAWSRARCSSRASTRASTRWPRMPNGSAAPRSCATSIRCAPRSARSRKPSKH